jgi:hypothetical protein
MMIVPISDWVTAIGIVLRWPIVGSKSGELSIGYDFAIGAEATIILLAIPNLDPVNGRDGAKDFEPETVGDDGNRPETGGTE